MNSRRIAARRALLQILRVPFAAALMLYPLLAYLMRWTGPSWKWVLAVVGAALLAALLPGLLLSIRIRKLDNDLRDVKIVEAQNAESRAQDAATRQASLEQRKCGHCARWAARV